LSPEFGLADSPFLAIFPSGPMPHANDWTIPGSDSQAIFGTTYQPDRAAVGCAIIAHGFKGYKDFRMIPAFARGLAEAGFVAHAFNFSHSGMTANPDTFERPDLFERDTWNRQVDDIGCVVAAVADGQLAGSRLSYVLLGHSRGGVSAILFAGRQGADSPLPRPAGLITAGTPDDACGLSDGEKARLRTKGYLESPSARTGQRLRIGRSWLAEQETDPEAHDVLALVRKISCPMLVIHGEDDETIDVRSASSLASAAVSGRLLAIKNCNHVFNTPNPPPADPADVPALRAAIDGIVAFARHCVAPASS
jgi:pimeloyl-ACP methyl ester carboxylesterase